MLLRRMYVRGNGYLTSNDVLQVINHINRGESELEAPGDAGEGEPGGDRGPLINYDWLTMVDSAGSSTPMSLPTPLAGSQPQADSRVNWFTAAVDDLAYWTTHRQPDLSPELASWQRPGADAWQSVPRGRFMHRWE